MNKIMPSLVSCFVRVPRLIGLLAGSLLFCSCSTSRLVDQDRVFEPGEHSTGSLIDSDVLLEEGASLHVNYLVGSRIFLKSGSTLSGFPKGASKSTIYAERGASYPQVGKFVEVRVVPTDNADALFRDRFRKLLPAGQEKKNPPVGGTVVVGGTVGYAGGYYHHRPYRYHSAPSRSASVKPDSYRQRD